MKWLEFGVGIVCLAAGTFGALLSVPGSAWDNSQAINGLFPCLAIAIAGAFVILSSLKVYMDSDNKKGKRH